MPIPPGLFSGSTGKEVVAGTKVARSGMYAQKNVSKIAHNANKPPLIGPGANQ